MSDNWKGIFAIPQSAYHEDGRFDYDGLDTQLGFCVASGAHGIVWPVMASQFSLLSHDERKKTSEQVVKKIDGRIPVVIGVATVWTEASVDLAQHAETNGADAIVSLPPWEAKPTREQAFGFYRALSNAVTIPIFVQNAGGKFGLAFSAEEVARMVNELDGVEYVKEEVAPAGQNITKVLAACGNKVKGVFGGAGCKFLLDELNRGSAGNMPACAMVDILAEIFNRFDSGDEAGARELHNLMAPYHIIHDLYGMGLTFEMLKRRGIIQNAIPRYGNFRPLDDHDERELSIILEALGPFFKTSPPI